MHLRPLPLRVDLHVRLLLPALDTLNPPRPPIKLRLVSLSPIPVLLPTTTSPQKEKEKQKTKLTQTTAPVPAKNAKTTTIIAIHPLRQYGASVAGYSTTPQNVYSTACTRLIAYSTTDLCASSPARWHITLAQPYSSGLTIYDVPAR
jgi:hypothetical protein